MAVAHRTYCERAEPVKPSVKKKAVQSVESACGHSAEPSSEMASPVPSSVCPTESSAVSTAVGETVELYINDGESSGVDGSEADVSDAGSVDSESGYDSDKARREHRAWVEVGSRLSRAFQVAADDDSSDEEMAERLAARWLNGPTRLPGESGRFTASSEAGFQGVLGSRNTRAEDAERNSRLALLENYGLLGAPTGTWRAPSSSPTASFECSEEDLSPEGLETLESGDGPEEWQNVGEMFIRAFQTSSIE